MWRLPSLKATRVHSMSILLWMKGGFGQSSALAYTVHLSSVFDIWTEPAFEYWGVWCNIIMIQRHLEEWVLNTDLRVCLSAGASVLEWRRGKRPERRFTGLFRGDLADNTGGYRSQGLPLGLSNFKNKNIYVNVMDLLDKIIALHKWVLNTDWHCLSTYCMR